MHLQNARENELPEVGVELREMVTDVQAKRVLPTSIDTRSMPKSLKIASDGGCQLKDSENTAVARQLRDAIGSREIHISDTNLLVLIVGSVISS